MLKICLIYIAKYLSEIEAIYHWRRTMRKIKYSFYLYLFMFVSNHLYLNAQTIYTIHSDQVLHTVDEKVYGQFLEHIYNSVNNGLWGDLIWNRSFERASGSGSWYQEGDEMVQSSNNENVRLLFGNVNWQNYEFTLQAKKDGGSEGFLILFRANGENFYWCNLGGWGNTLHAIEKGIPGVRWGVFGSQISGSIQTGRWYDIRIRCEGNHFQVWLDGNKLFDFNDNTATAHLTGQVGIGTWVTQARYRNFLVTDITSGDTLFNEIPTLNENESPVSNWQKVGTVQISSNLQALNSNSCVKLVNSQAVEAGIEQSGLNLKTQTYRGSFWARGTTPGNLTIRLMQGTQILAEKEFTGLGADWEEFPFELTPAVETTNGILRITFNDTGMVYLDQVSMMGQDAIDNDGFRPDLFQAVEALQPPCIRWPGGYFSELYRWKDGIGLQHERDVFPVEAWNDRDVNSFGTDEFIKMCRRLNAEPIIVINTGHRYSASPQTEYIEEAKHWLEYCNGPATSTWGAVRAANGHPEPYNVKYWEMGNEIFLTRSASIYVNFLKAFVPALKAVDSSITIIACGSGSFDQNWNRTVINECADIIDYISPHHYEGIENYRTGVINYENYTEELEGVIAASANPNIKIYMSEWNVWSGLDWRNGLYAGGMLTMFERQGEYMHMAGPALFLRHQIANDWNNALVNFNNSNWFPASNYVIMKFWRNHYAPNFLAIDGSHSSLNVSTTKTEDGQEIYFKAINTSASNLPVQIEIDGSFQLMSAILEQIAPGSLTAVNNMTNPDNIHVENGNVEIDSGRVQFTIPRYAGVIVTLSQNPVGFSNDNSINMIKDFHLYQNYPNPFNPSTTIQYDLAQSSDIEVNIYDNLGQLIRTYKCGLQNSGSHSTVWNGKNQRGDIVPAGIYFYQVNNGQSLLTKKMVFLK
jgi:alpha-N-arabinofuranosidase